MNKANGHYREMTWLPFQKLVAISVVPYIVQTNMKFSVIKVQLPFDSQATDQL